MNSLNSNPWRLLMVVVVIGFGYPVYEFLTLLCKCNVVKSFVLLLMTCLFFKSNITRRENAVRSLLCRHCCLSADHQNVEKERFMLDDLKIPAEWIHEAKVT